MADERKLVGNCVSRHFFFSPSPLPPSPPFRNHRGGENRNRGDRETASVSFRKVGIPLPKGRMDKEESGLEGEGLVRTPLEGAAPLSPRMSHSRGERWRGEGRRRFRDRAHFGSRYQPRPTSFIISTRWKFRGGENTPANPRYYIVPVSFIPLSSSCNAIAPRIPGS